MHPGNDNKKPQAAKSKSGGSSSRNRNSRNTNRRRPVSAKGKSSGSARWNKKRPSGRRQPAKSPNKPSVRTQQPTKAAPQAKPSVLAVSRPERNCDIVMNGGIAGAFVYPSAAVELAKTYRFRRIGGSSLGSLSAAFTAAAEVGRGSKNGGFPELSNTLNWMKEGREEKLNFYELLQAESETSVYFKALKKIKGKSRLKDMLAAGRASLGSFPLITLLALIPAILVGASVYFIGELVVQIVMGLVALLLAMALPPLASLLKLLLSARKALFRNGFGLCSGKASKGSKVSAIEWVSSSLNKLAGKSEDQLLTFNDLWAPTDEEEERNVELELTASDISLGQPVKFPQQLDLVEEPEDIYYFREDEMLKIFPENIVKHMVEKARSGKSFNKVKGFIPMPETADLPVVFALRLALSIPFVMSSVPLYKVSRIRQKGRIRWQMSKSWVTGAGLAGNFHVHSFDRPLPIWPTFGLHIAPVGGESEGYGDKKKGIWVQNLINQQGPSLWLGFNHFQSFLKAAFNVTANYEDRLLLQTPGFKERMAVVKIAQSQAGLFAQLDKETCDHLANLGENAARQLADRYSKERENNNSTSWDAHRWIRYRNAMALFEKKLLDFKGTYYDVHENEDTYDHLIMRGPEDPPDAFRWSDTGQRNHALRVTNQLLDFISRWQKDNRTFSSGDMPLPQPDMKIEPRK